MKNRTVIGIVCIVVALVVTFVVAPLVNQLFDSRIDIVRLKTDVDRGHLISEEDIEIVTIGRYGMVGDTITKNTKFQYEGKLYACLQDHVIMPHYYPSVNTASLYVEVTPEYTDQGEELGTLENPIPYEGNMVLENGKYYSQDGVTYLCNRDTGNPVYHALKDLVGLYVEVV